MILYELLTVQHGTVSGVARGGFGGGSTPPPIRIEVVFFHSRKVTAIKYYNVSLTTRRLLTHTICAKPTIWGEWCDCQQGRMRLDLDP